MQLIHFFSICLPKTKLSHKQQSVAILCWRETNFFCFNFFSQRNFGGRHALLYKKAQRSYREFCKLEGKYFSMHSGTDRVRLLEISASAFYFIFTNTFYCNAGHFVMSLFLGMGTYRSYCISNHGTYIRR